MGLKDERVKWEWVLPERNDALSRAYSEALMAKLEDDERQLSSATLYGMIAGRQRLAQCWIEQHPHPEAPDYYGHHVPSVEEFGIIPRHKRARMVTLADYRARAWMRRAVWPTTRDRPNRHDRKRARAKAAGLMREIVALLTGGG